MTEIKKIIIEVNGEELILSLEDAKKLHAALDQLFGKQATTYVYPTWQWQPLTYPQRYDITCGGTLISNEGLVSSHVIQQDLSNMLKTIIS